MITVEGRFLLLTAYASIAAVIIVERVVRIVSLFVRSSTLEKYFVKSELSEATTPITCLN